MRTLISDLTLNESTILAALKALEVGKATGPDEIPAKLLKETASVIAPSLCRIFNKSLQLGSLQSDWKLANVVHVHKKGAKDHVENYRPISLLPIVSKVFERCVLNSIRDHLYHVSSPKQHGFCTGRSCVTNLLEAFDHIGSLLDSGGQVDTIYLDMSKAFDKVSHRRFVHKLIQAGFGGTCLKGSALNCQVDANALRYSAPLQRIFMLPLDQPSSSCTPTTFSKSSVLAVEYCL